MRLSSILFKITRNRYLSKIYTDRVSFIFGYDFCIRQKGLVLGVYETDDENKVVLTSTAAKYNELVKGQLWKYILL